MRLMDPIGWYSSIESVIENIDDGMEFISTVQYLVIAINIMAYSIL